MPWRGWGCPLLALEQGLAVADNSWYEFWAQVGGEGWAERSPLVLLCHPSLLTAAGASGPRAPQQEGVGAGWLASSQSSCCQLLKSQGAWPCRAHWPGRRPHCPTP